MKHRIAFINLPLLAVFLVLGATAALASNTWYVDGVHGKNKNDCKSPQSACTTISHAISLSSSGDSIRVAAATYVESFGIAFDLKIVGSGAAKTQNELFTERRVPIAKHSKRYTNSVYPLR